MERSRMPVSAISRVRGIGLAVSVRTSTPSANRLTASLWVTPKRCSSSTTRRPSRLNTTSWPSSRCVPMTTSMLPSASPSTTFFCCAGDRNRLRSSTRTGYGAKRSAKVCACWLASSVVGRQDGGLRPVLHRLEHGPHRDLRLAEPHVAADQPVHRAWLFHVRLHVGDRLQLVFGLDELERGLHLGLPRGVGTEGVSLDRQAAPVELDQLVGHLAGGRPRLGPGALPIGPAHFRQGGGLPPAVGGDRLDLVDGEVQPVAAPVLQDQVVTRRPPHGPRRDAFEPGHTVLAVHHETSHGEVVEEAVGGAGPRPGPPVGHAPAGDVGFGQHGHPAVREDEAGRQGGGHHGGPGLPAALVLDRDVETLLGQHGRQPRGAAGRGRAQGDGVAVPDELGHLAGQSGGVPGDGAEARARSWPVSPGRPAWPAAPAPRPCSAARDDRRAGGGGGTPRASDASAAPQVRASVSASAASSSRSCTARSRMRRGSTRTTCAPGGRRSGRRSWRG